ncbi:MAG: lamin tail domain-containing protein, partial [Actinobacteria bacterium]|nr:lamin tail domain-containing protein [Actinomycetota bacterium]
VSKHYLAHIKVGARRLGLIGLHLLAQPNREDRREARQAQADAIRSMAIALQQKNLLPVVLGDFNDYDGAAESRDHVGSAPITTVLSDIRELDPDKSSDDLVNCAALVAQANRFTAFWDRDDDDAVDAPHELTSIDHVLLSPKLGPLVEHVTIDHAHDPRFVTDHFPVMVQLRLTEGGGGPGTSQVRILRLLPNPEGNENQNEEVTLINRGGQPQPLANWRLLDLTRKGWSLGGTIAPSETLRVVREGQQMALNNGGDTVDLVDAAGNVVHSVTYGSAEEGEFVFPTQ